MTAALFERCDDDRDVVLAERVGLKRLAIHVHDKALIGSADGIPSGRHEHARGINSHVSVRVAQDLEDCGGISRDRPLHFDAFVCH
jgi:hypothetical protein